ncbi:MAG: outer membrane receptor protein involved in Fe transport [Lysobacterales bacterium]|jgi:outer membrane receptor protein involved in Fe transport
MFKTNRVSLSFVALIFFALAPVAIFAQEITGSVRGTVSGPTGAPIAGSSVTVTDTRTGSNRTVTTTDTGAFSVRGLVVGGPYTIRVDSDDYQGTVVTDVFTTLAAASSFNIALEEQSGTMEEVIVVSSAAVAGADLALGPATSFNLAEIEAMPTITRQIRDVIRLDPRVSVGRASGGNGFGISCLGGSGRSNSFTIDGVRSSDGFGLNASGNSARNTFPIPFDTVRSASVEFAPIDVQYGSFTGCNINVVTKGGGNEFSATGFYLFNDDSYTGDTINNNKVITEPFEDTNWGVEFSGPIIKDKLFFYVSYEETDEGSAQNTGPIGGGFANERHLTIDDANTIANILRTQYGRDPGTIVRTLPQFSERTFGRLDWNINNSHRAELTYVKLEESNLEEDDFGFNGFTFSDNFEMEGTDQEATSFRLFSDWSDSFSTEVRFSSLEVIDIQGPAGGGEAQNDDKVRIIVENGTNGTDILTSGPGFFRSANDLKYSIDQAKLAGYWTAGDHRITAGYELDSLDVFNLFIPDATGTITFASIADLAAGNARSLGHNGSFTKNPNDAAASFARDIHTYYVQDEWQASDRLTVTGGVRFDTYESNDVPIFNPVFQQRYGFANTQSFDGLDLIMPRLGFTYDMGFDRWGEMTLRGGYGTFSGGDPTVHFANSYQNFGGAIGFAGHFSSPCTAADLQVLSSGSFNGLPECVRTAAQNSALQNQGPVNAIQPGFEIPSQNRFNIGMSLHTESDRSFLDDWQVEVDFIYSDHRDSIEYWDLTLTPNVDSNGNIIILPDGRPQFNAIDPLLTGCNAVFQGPGNGFAGVTTDCDAGGDDQDILMGNGISGDTTSISFQLAKTFDIGDKSSLNFRFGYAYTDSEVGNPVNSSTASSGYEEVAQAVINKTELGPAVYVNEHNFVIGTTFKHYFFEDHPTSIGLFFRRFSGRPISYTYDNNTATTLFGDSDNEERNLFYVPTGANDPLVDLTSLANAGTLDDFFAFLDRTGLSRYAGQISPKNGFNQEWNSDMDLRISQDIPLGDSRNSLKFFLDIENVMNMFSDNNNIRRYTNGGDIQEGVPVLDAALSSDGTQYIYSNFNPGGSNSSGTGFNPVSIDVDDSVWRIQLGLKYSFN